MVKFNDVVVETFLLPRGWRADNELCPVPFALSWLEDYYSLTDQERREKHENRFEKYMLGRREAERVNPPRDEE